MTQSSRYKVVKGIFDFSQALLAVVFFDLLMHRRVLPSATEQVPRRYDGQTAIVAVVGNHQFHVFYVRVIL